MTVKTYPDDPKVQPELPQGYGLVLDHIEHWGQALQYSKRLYRLVPVGDGRASDQTGGD